MFPLWDVAIEPTLRAIGARRIVEVGALRGENTVQILDLLGPEGELHVVDPVPGFDPEEHARQFDGRYVFHQALSVDVLHQLPVMDAALLDGDHNWYTVYTECTQLAEVARRADRALPVLILHDVLWPYGRRDLYYDPTNIPSEHLQPNERLGMRPGHERLVSAGGLNPGLHNALVEGGERNGVMTGLDDFIAEYDRPLRRLVLPLYFGLAIVVEEEQLDRTPELRAVFDRLESSEGRLELLELGETLRLRAIVFQHTRLEQDGAKIERATQRYLSTVKASLLNEHYLDHEQRFAYLAKQMKDGAHVDPVILRDPTRNVVQPARTLQAMRSGPSGPTPGAERSFVPYTAMGRTRLDHLHACLDVVRSEGIDGDLVECGTHRGGGAIFMRAYLDGHEVRSRDVWVVDQFRSSHGDDVRPTMPDGGLVGFRADVNLVRDGFERFGLLDDRVHFLQGGIAASLDAADLGTIAVLRLGHPVTNDTDAILSRLYDRLAIGGFVIVELGADDATSDAIDAFRAERGIDAPLHRIDDRSVAWRRSSSDGTRQSASVAAGTAAIPLAPAAPGDAVDLTVVVVFYDMKREAARTLRSLSRAYQERLDGVSYEVLAIENGSAETDKLGADFVHSFGPEFRYIDMGDGARPSPVTALNRGVAEGRGNAFALMIDGAHVLTPGVLHYGLTGLKAYAPAIVCTQQWYVGPGQQGDAMDNGYDQAYEDRLFKLVNWPHSGYRLFEIGHFISDRDWLDGLWESNCLFASRAQLRQVGAFDEAFDVAGGGYANLELYERLAASPDITLVTILGEGSFHQSHGGTTTNQPDPAERRSRVFGYGQDYARHRGRPFSGPGKAIHYVGRFPNADANRTRARRMSAQRFTEAAVGGIDGPPLTPSPVPDELANGFLAAVWQNMPWTTTSWLGREVQTPPTDLFAYQELIARNRPDWIIETCNEPGGRSLFLANVCDAIGHGRVLVVCSDDAGESEAGDSAAGLVEHHRLHVVRGVLDDTSTADEVRSIVGDQTALAVLGGRRGRAETVLEFNVVAPYVAVGSYVVVADTIVNGNPVWTGFGPGPAEAVKNILRLNGNFVQDNTVQTYSLSFGPGGFLRRVAD
jgi:cephalosporin hydroxylase